MWPQGKVYGCSKLQKNYFVQFWKSTKIIKSANFFCYWLYCAKRKCSQLMNSALKSKNMKKINQSTLLIRLCDLLAPLVLISSTSLRKACFLLHIYLFLSSSLRGVGYNWKHKILILRPMQFALVWRDIFHIITY